METYIPESALHEKFSIRFRYTRFSFFFFTRSIWRMEVKGKLWQKIAFAIAVQLLILTPAALIADILTLALAGLGLLTFELYTHYLRPLLQRLLLGAVSTLWKAIGWIIVILFIILVFTHFPEVKQILNNLVQWLANVDI